MSFNKSECCYFRTAYYSLLLTKSVNLFIFLSNQLGEGERSVDTYNNQTGKEGKGKLFLFLLFLLCLILILYPNFPFVLAVSNQIGEKGNGKFVLFSHSPGLFATTTMSTIAGFEGKDNYDTRAVGRRILTVWSSHGNRDRGNSGEGHDCNVQYHGQGAGAAVK